MSVRLPRRAGWLAAALLAFSTTLTACGTPAASPTATSLPPTAAAESSAPATEAGGESAAPIVSQLEPPCDELATPGPVVPPTASAVVAVVADGDIWVWAEAEGEAAARSIAVGDAVGAWPSPDGSLLALVREELPAGSESPRGPMSIWLMQADGSGLREIVGSAELEAELAATGGSQAAPYQVQWIPATHTLTYRVSPREVEGLGGPEPDLVHAVDADTGAVSELTRFESGWLVWSPSGDWGALGRSTDVGLVARAGDQVRTGDPIAAFIGLGHGSYLLHPAWSSDSGRFAVAAPQANPYADGNSENVPMDLWEYPVPMDPPDGAGRPLGRIEADVLAGSAFSPDLSLIAFHKSSLKGPGGSQVMHLSDVGHTWEITLPAASFRGWSPNSRHFLYRPDNPDSLVLGRLCAEPVTVEGSPGADADGPALWLDAESFVFLDTDEEEEHNTWHLRLGSLDGSSTELATFTHPERPELVANR